MEHRIEAHIQTLLADARRTPTDALQKALNSTLWSLVTVVYLLFSFLTHRWDITWILFLAASCVQCAVNCYFAKPETRARHWSSMLWTAVTTLYFFISFVTHRWDITWILFPIAVALMQARRLFTLWRNVE